MWLNSLHLPGLSEASYLKKESVLIPALLSQSNQHSNHQISGNSGDRDEGEGGEVNGVSKPHYYCTKIYPLTTHTHTHTNSHTTTNNTHSNSHTHSHTHNTTASHNSDNISNSARHTNRDYYSNTSDKGTRRHNTNTSSSSHTNSYISSSSNNNNNGVGLLFDGAFEGSNLWKANWLRKLSNPSRAIPTTNTASNIHGNTSHSASNSNSNTASNVHEYQIFVRPDPIPSNTTNTSNAPNSSPAMHFGNNNNYWFLFRISRTKASIPYRFHICNLSKRKTSYNHHLNVDDVAGSRRMCPLGIVMLSQYNYVEQGKGWTRVGNDIEYVTNPGSNPPTYTLSFTIQFEVENDSVYLAYAVPYSYSQLQHFLHEMIVVNELNNAHAECSLLCHSTDQHRCDVITITDQKQQYWIPPELHDPPLKVYPNTSPMRGVNNPNHPNLEHDHGASDGSSDMTSSATHKFASRGARVTFARASMRVDNLIGSNSSNEASSTIAEGSNDDDNEGAGAPRSSYVPPALIRIAKELEKDNLKRLKAARDAIIKEFNEDYSHAKPVFVVLARTHPGESCSSYVCEGMIRFLLSSSSVANTLRKKYVFKFIPMLNPDGVIAGYSRTDTAGFDLNRVWDNPFPQLHPTIYHTRQLLESLRQQKRLQGVIDLHGHNTAKGFVLHSFQLSRRIRSRSEDSARHDDDSDEETATPMMDHRASALSDTHRVTNNSSLLSSPMASNRDSRLSTATNLNAEFLRAAVRRSRLTNAECCALTTVQELALTSLSSAATFAYSVLHASLVITVQASAFTGSALPYTLSYLSVYDYARYGRILCLALAESLGDVSKSSVVIDAKPKVPTRKAGSETSANSAGIGTGTANATASVSMVPVQLIKPTKDSTDPGLTPIVNVAPIARRSLNTRRVSQFIGVGIALVAPAIVPVNSAPTKRLMPDKAEVAVNESANLHHIERMEQCILYDSDVEGLDTVSEEPGQAAALNSDSPAKGLHTKEPTSIRGRQDRNWVKLWSERSVLSDGEEDECYYALPLERSSSGRLLFGNLYERSNLDELQPWQKVTRASEVTQSNTVSTATVAPTSSSERIRVHIPPSFFPKAPASCDNLSPSRDQTQGLNDSGDGSIAVRAKEGSLDNASVPALNAQKIKFVFKMPSRNGEFPGKVLGVQRQMMRIEVKSADKIHSRGESERGKHVVEQQSKEIDKATNPTTTLDEYPASYGDNAANATVPEDDGPVESYSNALYGHELYLQEIQKRMNQEKTSAGGQAGAVDSSWTTEKVPLTTDAMHINSAAVEMRASSPTKSSERAKSPPKRSEAELIELLNAAVVSQLQSNKVSSRGDVSSQPSGFPQMTDGTMYCGFPVRSKIVSSHGGEVDRANLSLAGGRPNSKSVSKRPKSSQSRPKSSAKSSQGDTSQGSKETTNQLMAEFNQDAITAGYVSSTQGTSSWDSSLQHLADVHFVDSNGLSNVLESIAGQYYIFPSSDGSVLGTTDDNAKIDLDISESVLNDGNQIIEGIGLGPARVLPKEIKDVVAEDSGPLPTIPPDMQELLLAGTRLKTPSTANSKSFISNLGSSQFRWNDCSLFSEPTAVNFKSVAAESDGIKGQSHLILDSYASPARHVVADNIGLGLDSSPMTSKQQQPRPPSSARASRNNNLVSPRAAASSTVTSPWSQLDPQIASLLRISGTQS